MKRTAKTLGIVGVVVLSAATIVAYREGWLARARVRLAPFFERSRASEAVPSTSPTPAKVGTEAPPGYVPASAPEFPATPWSPDLLAAVRDLNLVGLDAGGRVESFTSQFNDSTWAADRAIDGDPEKSWCSAHNPTYPQELVFSFIGRQSVLVSTVLINPHSASDPRQRAKDVEIWGSMEGAADGFVRLGSATLRPESVDQEISFAPVEVRYLKLRVLSNQGDSYVAIAEVKVIEAQRAGYTSLAARNPEAGFLLSAVARTGGPAALPPEAIVPGAQAAACTPFAPTAPTVGRESTNVLVVERKQRAYTPVKYRPTDQKGNLDYSIYGRLTFRVVQPWNTHVGMLHGTDTVVLSQICEIKQHLSDSFKKALIAWVGLGNKLIIQDSDDCGSDKLPDYSFLPYKFATSNPGARGAASDRLLFVEENTIGNAVREDPSFLDIESWLHSTNGSQNEIGDSNTIIEYAPQWCGHLFGTNVLKKNGFMEAYAHYGKGLIIYDGFDNDQEDGVAYRQLVTRELAQRFNPDGLTCSARIGDFVITTNQRLKDQPMVPGRTYVYQLTLLSNQGYTGTIKLSLATTPPDPTMTYQFEPDTVELTEMATSTLTVATTRESLPALHMLSVRGTDATTRSNGLCLQLHERKTGAIQIVSTLAQHSKPTRNLEIILDVSGSMKLPLGGKTRWATALDVMKSVVEKLPDDFNVGLRAYSHRYPAKSRETCTDTELLLPVAKLDRNRMLSAVNQLKPRGETPLIYSILQAPGDLKPLGGGSVVVITDGEDTCKGDPVAAARQLETSGIDVTLNIVGFTLKGKKVQEQLTTLAESTGGRYYGAQSGEALARALWIAALEKFPYVIFDAAGKQIATGDAGAPPVELEPGEYRVVVKAADQELVEQVTVVPTGDTVLKVHLKGDRFVIER